MIRLEQPQKRIQLDVSLAIVNIVLLLILFFLATGQLLNPPAADVDLAETQDIPIEALPSPILIVADDDSWTLDGIDVVPALLDVALQGLPQADPLHVLIDRNAPATSLLTVMNNPAVADITLRLVTLRTTAGQP